MATAGSGSAIGQAEIRSDLARLAMPARSPVLVHSSLREVGPPTGGPAAVAGALRDVLGPRAAIVVPAFTARNSTTTREFRRRTARMTPEQREAEEAKIVPFDLRTTPAQDVGAFAEYIRSQPAAVRSAHPQTSFAALGPDAVDVTRDHALESHLGEWSPLARLYDRDAQVLLLGVGHANNTSLHLAEAKGTFAKKRYANGSPVVVDGRRAWVTYEGDDTDDGDFEALGDAFAETGAQTEGPAGNGTARLMSQRAVVDFAVTWMNANRP